MPVARVTSGSTGRFTSSTPLNGVNGATPSGNAMASFLLGYPTGDTRGNPTSRDRAAGSSLLRNYYGAYLQDDWRVSPKFTLNYGLRIEHEDGLHEKNDDFTVAFDRTLNPGGALGATS